jgi:hypothetical protein
VTPEEYAQIRDAYKPLVENVDFEDYGPAYVPEGTFEYLGKHVRLSEVTDKQVASLIATQFVQTCANAKAAGVPYKAHHIGNLIAESLVSHGGFHRSSACFDGLEPQRELGTSSTPIYDEMQKQAIQELVDEDDEEECIGLEDMVGWLKEGLFLAGEGGSYSDVTDPSRAVINGTFDLEALAEHMMLHIWDDDEEEDDE